MTEIQHIGVPLPGFTPAKHWEILGGTTNVFTNNVNIPNGAYTETNIEFTPWGYGQANDLGTECFVRKSCCACLTFH